MTAQKYGHPQIQSENCVNLPKDRAAEILELCLANEPPEIRSKVYEIIHISGLEPSDPLFLVLALTGQLRFFLELAPAELREAIASAIVYQEQCLVKFQQSIEEASTKSVEEIRTLYKSLISEILEANSGVENIVIESIKDITTAREQLIELNNKLKIERDTNVRIMKSLIEGVGKTTADLELANFQIKNSIDILNKTRLSIKSFDKRVILIALMIFLVFLSLFSFGIFK